MNSIADNISQVQAQIDAACLDTGRGEHNKPLLLAVSKTRENSELREAYDAGLRAFGENYLQEALDKIDALKELEIEWHFIGPIQSNKTRAIAEHFDWVHSVDRLKIARRLSDQRPAELPPLQICLQVNISKEHSKSGCMPAETAAVVEELVKLPNIKLRGLMAIPAATDDASQQRQAFKEMKELLQLLQQQHPDLDTLSMGMSGDLEAAIAEGSTIVRIGTALFGPRNYANN